MSDDLAYVKNKLVTVSGHCAKNRVEICNIEKQIKQNVATSLIDWSTSLDRRHDEWQSTAQKHLQVIEQEVGRVSAKMLAEIDKVRQSGKEAVDNMMQLVEAENLKLNSRGDKLEAFAMVQISTLESRLEKLDLLVQEAVETLNDAKSRQTITQKVIGKLEKQGPLVALLRQDDMVSKDTLGNLHHVTGKSGHRVTDENIQCRVDASMQRLRQRSSSRSRELVQAEDVAIAGVADRITRAQFVAASRRGRSLSRRMEAAQELAADSARRIASEPPCVLSVSSFDAVPSRIVSTSMESKM